MIDGEISISKVVTVALWTWTVLVMGGAWLAWTDGLESLWMMLGFTACASSAVAATAQIRCYAIALHAAFRGVALAEEGRRVRPLR